jgi:hypothetical protein
MIDFKQLFDSIKSYIKRHATKILIVLLVISFGINIGLLIGNIEISSRVETTVHNNQATKVDTWAVSQSQSISLLINNTQVTGNNTVVITNVNIKQLIGIVMSMNPYSFLYKSIINIEDDKYLLIYPEVKSTKNITKVSNYSLLSNTQSIKITNNLTPLWKSIF